MADLSKLSDEQLQSLLGEQHAAPNPTPTGRADLTKLSDADLNSLVHGIKPEQGIGQSIMSGIGAASEFVDKFTGAPARAGLGELIQDTSGLPRRAAPEQPAGVPSGSEFLGTNVQPRAALERSLGESIAAVPGAVASQFGEDPSLAPTGKELAVRAGVSPEEFIPGATLGRIAGQVIGGPIGGFVGSMAGEKLGSVSPAGIAGVGIEAAADPLNIVPFGTLAKGAKAASNFALKGSVAALGKVPVVGTTGKVIKSGAEATSLAFKKLFKPQVADDAKDLSAIAEKIGVDLDLLPESIEFGDRSLISRMTRVQREGILGEELLDKFDKGLEQVRGALQQKMETISGGPILNRQEAGSLIRDSYNKGLDETLSGMDVTYNKIGDMFPDLNVPKEDLTRIQKRVNVIRKDLFERGKFAVGTAEKQQINTLEDALIKIEKAKFFGGYKDLLAVQKSIGKAAFQNKNPLANIDLDLKELRGLYGDLRKGLFNSVETLGKKQDNVVKVTKDGFKQEFVRPSTRGMDNAQISEKFDIPIEILDDADALKSKASLSSKLLRDLSDAKQFGFAVMNEDPNFLPRLKQSMTDIGISEIQTRKIDDVLKQLDDLQDLDDIPIGKNIFLEKSFENIMGQVKTKSAAHLIGLKTANARKAEAMRGFTEKNVVPIVEKLKQNNAAMSQIFEDKDLFKSILGNKRVSDERAFESVTNATNKIEALKRILPPEDMAAVKGAFIDNLIKRDLGDASEFTFANVRNALRRKMDVAREMFEPQELSDLIEIVRLGDRFGPAMMSSSQTGASNILKDIFKAVGQGVTNETFIAALKKRARSGKGAPAGLQLPPAAGLQLPKRALFGPQAIGPKELFGLRLPQQISRQQQDKR